MAIPSLDEETESLHHSRNTSAINPLDPNLHVNTQQSHSSTSRNPLSTLNSNEVYANDELDAEEDPVIPRKKYIRVIDPIGNGRDSWKKSSGLIDPTISGHGL
ncbi:16795_t:CDS:2 [Funneliformis mosseae]|uniref:16795_t:CDS:1 n=1 Tax=Funneliformis mosseae TaxID=27381 RepID=A0A9N9C1Y5_FUNMO|nr:16795_t:CDS:2 [Funneliformis mosseae]